MKGITKQIKNGGELDRHRELCIYRELHITRDLLLVLSFPRLKENPMLSFN